MRKSALSSQALANWEVGDLGRFYVINRSALVRRANRTLNDTHKAEEIVHEALMKVVLASPELGSDQEALAYVYKTIDNLCIDYFRYTGRRPQFVLLDGVNVDLEPALQDAVDISDKISAAEDAALIRQALSLLSPAERTALVMWEMEGRSTKEIAKELGLKESTVRQTVSRARTSLRKILAEYIVDEKRGLTALDLLSSTYKRASAVAKDFSKIALSMILLFFAYLGFALVPAVQHNPPETTEAKVFVPKSSEVESGNSSAATGNNSHSSSQGVKVSGQWDAKKEVQKASNVKSSFLNYAGLDKSGVPTGFTVADSQENLGSLYFSGKDGFVTEDGITLSSNVKTSGSAANIFLAQSLVQNSSGIAFDAVVSYGKKGNWIPLVTQILSTESERLGSGNYLITSVLQVKSEVGTAITIPAFASGRDLDMPPSRVVVRLVLNQTKSQVLSEAILVVERNSR